jgi:hypothetical protein
MGCGARSKAQIWDIIRSSMHEQPIRLITLLAICCICALNGCASRSVSWNFLSHVPANDVSRNSVADISSGVIGWMSLPRRDLIRVDFTSGTDLRNMVVRGGSILFLHSYFCDDGSPHRSAGDPGVYVDLTAAHAETVVNQFFFFIDVSRKPRLDLIPPEPGFDLSVKAQDVCFYVTAHSGLKDYTSKVGRIPKQAIAHTFEGWDAH